ncbi:hypothetical protein HKX48_001489 [Thoreauomyces humboldtii]|nr:hypothetical protein HKX48_001489 [Thoreauomyces humboldtii]
MSDPTQHTLELNGLIDAFARETHRLVGAYQKISEPSEADAVGAFANQWRAIERIATSLHKSLGNRDAIIGPHVSRAASMVAGVLQGKRGTSVDREFTTCVIALLTAVKEVVKVHVEHPVADKTASSTPAAAVKDKQSEDRQRQPSLAPSRPEEFDQQLPKESEEAQQLVTQDAALAPPMRAPPRSSSQRQALDAIASSLDAPTIAIDSGAAPPPPIPPLFTKPARARSQQPGTKSQSASMEQLDSTQRGSQPTLAEANKKAGSKESFISSHEQLQVGSIDETAERFVQDGHKSTRNSRQPESLSSDNDSQTALSNLEPATPTGVEKHSSTFVPSSPPVVDETRNFANESAPSAISSEQEEAELDRTANALETEAQEGEASVDKRGDESALDSLSKKASAVEAVEDSTDTPPAAPQMSAEVAVELVARGEQVPSRRGSRNEASENSFESDSASKTAEVGPGLPDAIPLNVSADRQSSVSELGNLKLAETQVLPRKASSQSLEAAETSTITVTELLSATPVETSAPIVQVVTVPARILEGRSIDHRNSGLEIGTSAASLKRPVVPVAENSTRAKAELFKAKAAIQLAPTPAPRQKLSDLAPGRSAPFAGATTSQTSPRQKLSDQPPGRVTIALKGTSVPLKDADGPSAPVDRLAALKARKQANRSSLMHVPSVRQAAAFFENAATKVAESANSLKRRPPSGAQQRVNSRSGSGSYLAGTSESNDDLGGNLTDTDTLASVGSSFDNLKDYAGDNNEDDVNSHQSEDHSAAHSQHADSEDDYEIDSPVPVTTHSYSSARQGSQSSPNQDSPSTVTGEEEDAIGGNGVVKQLGRKLSQPSLKQVSETVVSPHVHTPNTAVEHDDLNDESHPLAPVESLKNVLHLAKNVIVDLLHPREEPAQYASENPTPIVVMRMEHGTAQTEQVVQVTESTKVIETARSEEAPAQVELVPAKPHDMQKFSSRPTSRVPELVQRPVEEELRQTDRPRSRIPEPVQPLVEEELGQTGRPKSRISNSQTVDSETSLRERQGDSRPQSTLPTARPRKVEDPTGLKAAVELTDASKERSFSRPSSKVPELAYAQTALDDEPSTSMDNNSADEDDFSPVSCALNELINAGEHDAEDALDVQPAAEIQPFQRANERTGSFEPEKDRDISLRQGKSVESTEPVLSVASENVVELENKPQADAGPNNADGASGRQSNSSRPLSTKPPQQSARTSVVIPVIDIVPQTPEIEPYSGATDVILSSLQEAELVPAVEESSGLRPSVSTAAIDQLIRRLSCLPIAEVAPIGTVTEDYGKSTSVSEPEVRPRYPRLAGLVKQDTFGTSNTTLPDTTPDDGVTSNTETQQLQEQSKELAAPHVDSSVESHTPDQQMSDSDSVEPARVRKPSLAEAISAAPASTRPTQPYRAVRIGLTPLNGQFTAFSMYLHNNLRLGRGVARDGFKAFASQVVSRNHCDFMAKEERVYIKDCGSNSGTFVNGMRLSSLGTESELKELHDGDLVQLGKDYEGAAGGNVPEARRKCVKISIKLELVPDLRILAKPLNAVASAPPVVSPKSARPLSTKVVAAEQHKPTAEVKTDNQSASGSVDSVTKPGGSSSALDLTGQRDVTLLRSQSGTQSISGRQGEDDTGPLRTATIQRAGSSGTVEGIAASDAKSIPFSRKSSNAIADPIFKTAPGSSLSSPSSGGDNAGGLTALPTAGFKPSDGSGSRDLQVPLGSTGNISANASGSNIAATSTDNLSSSNLNASSTGNLLATNLSASNLTASTANLLRQPSAPRSKYTLTIFGTKDKIRKIQIAGADGTEGLTVGLKFWDTKRVVMIQDQRAGYASQNPAFEIFPDPRAPTDSPLSVHTPYVITTATGAGMGKFQYISEMKLAVESAPVFSTQVPPPGESDQPGALASKLSGNLADGMSRIPGSRDSYLARPDSPASYPGPSFTFTGNLKEHKYIIVMRRPNSREQRVVGEAAGRQLTRKSVLEHKSVTHLELEDDTFGQLFIAAVVFLALSAGSDQ